MLKEGERDYRHERMTTHRPIIDRCRRTIFGWAVAPATAVV